MRGGNLFDFIYLFIYFLFLFSILPGDGAKVVETVGATLIQEYCDDRQIRALKSLGGNMYHFLTTLDGVHDVLQMGDDKVRWPIDLIYMFTSYLRENRYITRDYVMTHAYENVWKFEQNDED